MHVYKVETIKDGQVADTRTFVPARLGATSDSYTQIEALVYMRTQAEDETVETVNFSMDNALMQTLNGADYRRQLAEEKMVNALLADPAFGPRIIRGELTVEQAIAQQSKG